MANKSISKSKILLASAAAGLMTLAVAATPEQAWAEEATDAGVKCYGVNKCKGSGECGGKGYSCAGKNECAGHGWIKLAKDKCLAIKGGRLTPEAAE